MRKATAAGHLPGQIRAKAFIKVCAGVFLCALPLAALKSPRAATVPSHYLVYVGTYTSAGSPAKPTGSKGIYVYRFDAGTGEVEGLGLAAASEQPSFLASDPAGKFIFAVNETDSYQGQASGGVSSFSIDRETGMLTPINEIASRGSAPAHISVDHTGKYALVSNYNGGNLAVFAISPDGHLGAATAFVQHHGSSVNKDRQAGPHVHQTILSPDNRFAISADLGLDELYIYPFDASGGLLGPEPRVLNLPSGSGPRHVAFAPSGNFAYLVSEMASTVSVMPYDPKSGAMAVREIVRLAPQDDEPAQKWAGEVAVAPSGKYVYASNRGDDFIAVFSIEPETGMIDRSETIHLEGKTPRNFAIDPSGAWLWDANQDSNNIILFRLDQQRGNLQPSGLAIKVGAPTCVVFVPIS
jgi:6-phosphogluconolactonase